MTIETTKRWNAYIDRMMGQLSDNHTVNLKEFLSNLKHCATTEVQDSGQRYIYVQMGDLDHAISEAVTLALTTQPKVLTILPENFGGLGDQKFVELFDKYFHGIRRAETLLDNSAGCSEVEIPYVDVAGSTKLSIKTDLLRNLLKRRIDIEMHP